MGWLGFLTRKEEEKTGILPNTATWEIITKDGSIFTLYRTGVDWKIFIPVKRGFRRNPIFSFGATSAGEVKDLRKHIGQAIIFDAKSTRAQGRTSPIKSVKNLTEG